MIINHPILTPAGVTVFVGGCKRRGEGSRFRAKAHSHYDEPVVCYLSTKWLDCRELALHELAHIRTGKGHTDKWRKELLALGGTLDEVPGILRSYHKKKRATADVLKSALVVLSLAVALSAPARAWETAHNPDVSPSIGWGVHGGQLAGIAIDKAAYTEFGADFRAPVTNYLTLSVDYAHTTVSNAPTGVSTDSNRIGGNVRVYLRDMWGD